MIRLLRMEILNRLTTVLCGITEPRENEPCWDSGILTPSERYRQEDRDRSFRKR